MEQPLSWRQVPNPGSVFRATLGARLGVWLTLGGPFTHPVVPSTGCRGWQGCCQQCLPITAPLHRMICRHASVQFKCVGASCHVSMSSSPLEQ